jgi:hypothetical protein
MTSILVWYLVSVSNGSSNMGNVQYSPPLATLEDCQRIQKFFEKYVVYSQCIQVKKASKK